MRYILYFDYIVIQYNQKDGSPGYQKQGGDQFV